MSLFVILVAALLAVCNAVVEPNQAELRAIAECLDRFGGLTSENAERLERFKNWSDDYEEIPCFTKCYLSKMFDLYDETKGFSQENVIKQFGHPLFNACKHRMIHGSNSCQMAYNGFHCLVSLENDPFVVIESMEKLNSEAKTAMKDCLYNFNQFKWHHINDYANFPVREPIPCFTKCFVEKLKLLNTRARIWNIDDMRTNLGIPALTADTSVCSSMNRKRHRNSCTWMYQEFTCFAMAKELN